MIKSIKHFYLKDIALLLSVAIFFIADRIFKSLALNDAFIGGKVLIPQIIQLNLAKNYYIAFSLPLYGLALNLLISAIIISLASYIFYLILNKKSQKLLIYPLTFILFGAISNLYDRLKFGYVIDYFDLSYFTVFNLADAMIVLGIIYILFKQKYV